MQFHLESDELNLLANLLMQRTTRNDEILEIWCWRATCAHLGTLEAVADLLAAEETAVLEGRGRARAGQCAEGN